MTPEPSKEPPRHAGIELVRQMPGFTRHPVVADANVLLSDLFRYRSTRFTVLTFLAEKGAITLLTATHARQRIPELIAEKSGSPVADLRRWRSVYLPIVRFVEIPGSMCAGEQRVESIADPEDVPFARLALATAPSLLLTRDHHVLDAGLGTEAWAEALTILGTLVEIDALVYGSSHGALLAARLFGLLASGLWRVAAQAPLVTAALGMLALIYSLARPMETLAAARRSFQTLKASGARLLELSEPALERRNRAESALASRLERPILPRSIESACARALAVRASPLAAGELVGSLGARAPSEAQLTRLLRAHPSFTAAGAERWELGELGMPVIEGSSEDSDTG